MIGSLQRAAGIGYSYHAYLSCGFLYQNYNFDMFESVFLAEFVQMVASRN